MNILIEKRKWFLLGLGLVTLIFGWGVYNIRTEFSFDKFRKGDDGEAAFYERFSEVFPHDDNVVQIAIRNKSDNIWDAKFLADVDAVFKTFAEIQRIDSIISPTEIDVYRRIGLGVTTTKLLQYGSEEELEASKVRLQNDSLLYSNFFSENREYIGGIVAVDPDILDLPVRDSVSYMIRDRLEATGYEYVISGIPYIRTQYIHTIKKEMFSFVALSVLLSMIIMFILYRSWWGVLLPLLGVGLAMIWTVGFMGLTGQPLDMLSNLIPSIMFVVGIADIIHLFTRYQQDLASGLSRKEAMKATVGEIGMAIFLTSLTTAIGFTSLLVSPLPPIQLFGVYAAAGVLFAFIIAMALVPSGLMLVNPEKVRTNKGAVSWKGWDRFLAYLYKWVKANPMPIVVGTVLLLALSGWGISRISFDSYLLDDISEDDPAKVSMTFFEDNFYGSRPFEMAIMPKGDHEVAELEILQDVEKIQEYLASLERISPFMSLVNYLKSANQIYRGGSNRFYRLPRKQERVDELIGFGLTSGGKELLDRIVNEDLTMARVSARMGDVGTYRFGDLRDSLDKFIHRECNLDNFEYRLTGSPIIVEENVVVLREGLFAGLALAFSLVGILMGGMFRSWRMVFIGVVPNVIPLLVTAGMMGFLGITLRASTSIVFLVAFGIAVDDTIHFLGRLRIEFREGKDLETAIENAVLGTGKALVITTLILLTGFLILLGSDFGGTYSVGLFTGLTLLVALFSDLLLLPVLVRWSKIGNKQAKQFEKEKGSLK